MTLRTLHPVLTNSKTFVEILIAVLTTWRILGHFRAIQTLSKEPIVQILTRDSVVHALAIVLLRIWNCIIWCFLPQSMLYLGIYLVWSLVSVSVSRFFLNLKQALVEHDEALEQIFPGRMYVEKDTTSTVYVELW